MADIDRYRPEDRRGVEQLYRRTFGTQAADALRLRWDWARRNPTNSGSEPAYYIVREGPTVVAACPLMPVRVSIRGLDTDGSWSADPLVVAERQRQGLGEALLRAWDRQSSVALGANLSEGTRFLLEKMHWPKPVTVPCLVKPLSRRAVRRPSWPMPVNRLVSAITLPVVLVVARARPLREQVEVVRRFDRGLDRLWEHIAPRLDLAVRRDAAYLNWKFIEPPHIRYSVAVLKRNDEPHGYAVYRHLREPQGRVTQIVDFLVDPSDERGLKTLLRWVDREARAEDSDKIRCYVQHAQYRRVFRRSGYFVVKSNVMVSAKVNAVQVPPDFYDDADDWHVTWGDGELDH
jgi:Acetyltransferase (GNAT) domain